MIVCNPAAIEILIRALSSPEHANVQDLSASAFYLLSEGYSPADKSCQATADQHVGDAVAAVAEIRDSLTGYERVVQPNDMRRHSPLPCQEYIK